MTEDLRRTGFVIFAAREASLVMRLHQNNCTVDFKIIKERWENMSGRKKNLYNKEAEKDPKIQRVCTWSRKPRMAFQFYQQEVACLEPIEQIQSWKRIPPNKKQIYCTKAIEELDHLTKRPHPLPEIKDGVAKLWSAIDFYKDQALIEAIKQNSDFPPEIFEMKTLEYWELLSKEQQEPYLLLEFREIEAVAARIEKEGFNPIRPDLSIQFILANIRSRAELLDNYVSKYWSLVDGLCSYMEDSSEDKIAEEAINKLEKCRMQMEVLNIDNNSKLSLSQGFKDMFKELMWRVKPEYSNDTINRVAAEYWNWMDKYEIETIASKLVLNM
ncbi:hypothetical protein TVAG_350890 [Trichomonas vaginalis G3]|uniref:Uncharacterized protein n=1 Tax=Trichomonas vaginalis (strain ATCC PRA-98 / G3) TaxID=412133 RepID=A2FUL5_TRIV3|nr:HMG-box family [Trichomonas vaginalis G3]EAX91395.1 hypothetical protein TVAG_350890 [Trichomonas vaginalis G3]KAI5545611.1 HMG-box family [Trichomonas vaginalis G3]|eukprot:XP_001304325.1 hypothetical protein [Trichomonas vaginalis G3]